MDRDNLIHNGEEGSEAREGEPVVNSTHNNIFNLKSANMQRQAE